MKRKCSECGKYKKDVRRITCGYHEEISGTIVKETICEDCELQHLQDI